MDIRRNGQELLDTLVDVDALDAAGRAALGEKVRELRIALGLKQSEVAEAAGVALKTYGTLERGQRAAQPDNLRKVLEVLGVPQVTDLDRYDEDTRVFIATTAPIFQQLPRRLRANAQLDVVSMLAGRLSAQPSRPTLTPLNVPGPVEDVALAAYDDPDWQERQEQENE